MKKIISSQLTLSLSLLILLSSCGQEAGGGEGTDGVAVADHRIFVTSVSYTGAELGGLANADSKCTSLAATAGLERNYKAIVSDTSGNAKNRLVFTGGVYAVPSSGESELIVATGSDLWGTDTKNLLTSVNIDENGSSASSYVWTGTDSDGAVLVGEHCSNWTSTASSGRRGHTDQSDDRWVEDTDISCTNSYPIYCISQK